MSERAVQGRGLEVAAVTPADRRIIDAAFKNPLEIPPVFKGWLEAYLEPLVKERVDRAIAQIPGFVVTGTPDGTKFLHDDQSWQNIPAPAHLAGMGFNGAQLAVTANTVYLVPIAGLVTPTSISRIIWALTSVVAGNYDVGVYYSDDEATFTRLVSKGSTAQPAAGNIISTVTPSVLTPVVGRRWYYAIALSTASSVGASAFSATAPGGIPGYTKATSFPLPSSLTGMTAIGASPLPVLHGAV